MKFRLILTLALALAWVPAWTVAADGSGAEGEKAEKAAAKPKPKKKVSNKPTCTSIDQALKITSQTQEPIVGFLIPAESPLLPFFKKKVLSRKEFQEFVKKNCVVYMPKLSKDPKAPKKLNVKKIKPADRKFLDDFAIDPKAVSAAKAQAMPEPTAEDLVNYPAVVVVDSAVEKLVFRMPKLDEDGGFGVWILELTERLRDAGMTVEIPPKLKKILDNPMAEANAGNRSGGKKK